MIPAQDDTEVAGEAVRRYLMYLRDPESVRDHERIEKQTQEAENATDPLEQLAAWSEVDRLTSVDEVPIRDGFIAHARTWAEANPSVTVAAFLRLRVPPDILRKAGFTVSAKDLAAASDAPVPRRRRGTVGVEQVRTHILGLSGEFTSPDIVSLLGCSSTTVARATRDLVGSGHVRDTGRAVSTSGGGRAPKVYVRTSKRPS